MVSFEWPVFEVALRHMEGGRCDVTSRLDMGRAVRVLGVASFYCLSDLQHQAEAYCCDMLALGGCVCRCVLVGAEVRAMCATSTWCWTQVTFPSGRR